jgi:hypothetical protein
VDDEGWDWRMLGGGDWGNFSMYDDVYVFSFLSEVFRVLSSSQWAGDRWLGKLDVFFFFLLHGVSEGGKSVWFVLLRLCSAGLAGFGGFTEPGTPYVFGIVIISILVV